EDVIFSLETLRDRGRPNHRLFYSKVSRIERPGPGRVRFFLEGGDREMPLILGLMPILSERHFRTHDFDAAGLVPPVGSGPYRVGEVDVGTRIVFERNKDYWGAHLGVNRGRYNFDSITYDYYRDDNAAFEAFKAGLIDVRTEGDAARWQGAYDFPAIVDGRVVQHVFEKQTPSGMYGMVFNTRRPVFADKRVRRALTLLFDFEWVNKNLLYGLYRRTNSYFDSSVLSSHERAASARERELLAPFDDAVDDEILENGYTAPQSDGSGRNREHRREALALLESAGYRVEEGVVVNENDEPLSFEILIARVADERLALQYAEQLSRAGIEAQVRVVDSSQYQQRLQGFDYDMIFNSWYASLSLGNEQSLYWGSEAADAPGSRNYMGAREAGVDAMIAAILEARDRDSYISAARALDRVLLSGEYVIPLFHVPGQWVAAWSRIRWPEATSLYGYREDSWWIEE
ncbi:MAG: extracellular solute-binding protein, partial [Hyphomicrobiales bacterium]|nr:extracellular solute-binding protein [Hyphomicrobiales bacterium]